MSRRGPVDSPEKMPALLPGAVAIWWEVPTFSHHIEPVQVAKETAKTVQVVYRLRADGGINTRTMHKHRNLFSSWEAALQAAIAHAEQKIENQREAIERETRVLAALRTLKAPAP